MGRSIAPLSDRELSRERLRFGYLSRWPALFDSLTVYENVAFGLRQKSQPAGGACQEIVRDRLRDVGLSRMSSNTRSPPSCRAG